MWVNWFRIDSKSVSNYFKKYKYIYLKKKESFRLHSTNLSIK